MKNKKMVYSLGLLVCIVWGMILYRVFTAINHDEDSGFNNSTITTVKERYNDYSFTKDTAKLALHYRDPFSAVNIIDTVIKHIDKKAIKTSVASIKPVFNWGFVKYSGYVRNPNSKKLIAIININGKNVMLAEGESSGDVKLIKNLKDSVKISFKNQTKFLGLNFPAI